MSMEFGFAAVPFSKDGYLDELFKDDKPREGVIFLETKGASLPLGYLGINIAGVDEVNEMTQGAFFELCDSDENQRYILLEPRRQNLARLCEMLPNLPEDTGWQREFKGWLACLLDNADAYLVQYGEQAALLIY